MSEQTAQAVADVRDLLNYAIDEMEKASSIRYSSGSRSILVMEGNVEVTIRVMRREIRSFNQ